MTAAESRPRPRLKQRYDDSVRAELQGTLGLSNVMEVPRLEKIVLNMGVGKATQQPSLIEGAVRDLEVIAGQKPVVTRATMQGGIIDKDMPMPVSSVAIVCPGCGPSRIGYRIDEATGRKVRVCRKCGGDL